jgi:hypothetical protein
MAKSEINDLKAMKIVDWSVARKKGLIQHTVWVSDNMEERAFLKRCQDQVLINPRRTALIVRNGGRLSLYVDDVSYCRKVAKSLI